MRRNNDAVELHFDVRPTGSGKTLSVSDDGSYPQCSVCNSWDATSLTEADM